MQEIALLFWHNQTSCPDTSRCSPGPYSVDTYRSAQASLVRHVHVSTSLCSVDKSGSSTVSCSLVQVQLSSGPYSVDASRSSKGSYCPDAYMCSSGPCSGVDKPRSTKTSCCPNKFMQVQVQLRHCGVDTSRCNTGLCGVVMSRCLSGPWGSTLCRYFSLLLKKIFWQEINLFMFPEIPNHAKKTLFMNKSVKIIIQWHYAKLGNHFAKFSRNFRELKI